MLRDYLLELIAYLRDPAGWATRLLGRQAHFHEDDQRVLGPLASRIPEQPLNPWANGSRR